MNKPDIVELTKLAEQGNPDSQNELASHYFNGVYIEQNYEKAVFWLIKSAQQKDIVGMVNLGRLYAEGIGIEKNLIASINLHVEAMCCGADKYLIFDIISIDEIIEIAQNDDEEIVRAQFYLGVCYYEGVQHNDIEIEKNNEKAFYWFKKAANKKYPLAMVYFGILYAEGAGVDKDLITSLNWLTEAIGYGADIAKNIIHDLIGIANVIEIANQGNVKAQLFLGICFSDGEGVEKDVSLGTSWYEKAAVQNEPLALLLYGIKLYDGVGVNKNLFLALEKLLQAYESGVMKAEEYITPVREQIQNEFPYFLVKVTDRRWADVFLDGNVFMRRLSEFSIDHLIKHDPSLENDYRGDLFEGLVSTSGLEGSSGFHRSMREMMINRGVPEEAISFGEIDSRFLEENVFSLYSLYFDKTNQIFQKPSIELEKFGDTAVIIFDVYEFLIRIVKSLSKSLGSQYWFAYKQVIYGIDTNEKVLYDEFCKSASYSWQNEFRVVLDINYPDLSINPEMIIYNLENGAITLKIDDIRDIAFAMPIKEFCKLDFSYEQRNKFTLPPETIYPLGLPRPKRVSYANTVIKIDNQLMISQNALYPIKWKEDKTSTPSHAYDIWNLNEAEDSIKEKYIEIANIYFKGNFTSIIRNYGKTSQEMSLMSTEIVEYMINAKIINLGGIKFTNDRRAKIDFKEFCFDDALHEQKQVYQRINTISDFALLATATDETKFDEYEYEGNRYIRIVTNKDVTLNSGDVVKQGEAVWLEVNPVSWFLVDLD